jgi:exopolysaccharide biosynthesis polyprenyl glycosylphosphotransferase
VAADPITEGVAAPLPAGANAGALGATTAQPEAVSRRESPPPHESHSQRALEAIRRRDTRFRRSLALADCVALAATLWVGVLLLGDDRLAWATLAAFPLVILAGKIAGLYDRDENLIHKATLDEIPTLFEMATFSALLFWLLGPQLVDGNLGRRQIIGIWAVFFVMVVICRSVARFLARQSSPPERCLVVGRRNVMEELTRTFAASPSLKAEVVDWMDVEDWRPSEGRQEAQLWRLSALLDHEEIHRVILAPGEATSDEFLDTIRDIKSQGVKVSVLPAISQVVGSSVEVDQLGGISLLGIRRFEMTASSRLLKRWFDVAGSALALIVLSPLLMAIAIAAKVSSHGPVLFRQTRVGRRGKHFQMLKFRSMVADAEQRKSSLRHLNEADGLFKIADDPRITPFGRWLRRWSLDELPQLVHVLRGEMSLVGPRPLVPEEDSQIEGWHRRRLDLAPGMTGYWQSLGSSRIPLRDMVMIDFVYAADWSIWNDLRIIMRTVPFVLGSRGL